MGGEQLAVKSVSMSPDRFLLSPFQLLANSLYEIRLTAFNSDNNFLSTSSITVWVQRSSLKAFIDGGVLC